MEHRLLPKGSDMVIANVAVVLASAVVFPSVTYFALRQAGGAAAGAAIDKPRHTPLGISAFLIFCVLVIYVAGFYATRPFDEISPFMNMYLPCMLVVEIYLRKGTTYGKIVALFWGAIVLAAVVVTILYQFKK